MKRAFVLIVAVALLGRADSAAAASVLRVLTYNIHHGEGTDGNLDLERLAKIINDTGADLVALQEVDQGTARAGSLNEMTELGRLTAMHWEFGKTMDFQGGAYGVGVLSRWPIISSRNHSLPGSADREPRTALTVDVKIRDGEPPLQFTSTHLDQGRDLGSRVEQATALNALLARDGNQPTILAGDMNSRVDSDVMAILTTAWTNVSPDPALVDPTVRPQYRVDYVLVRPSDRWRVIESSVVNAPGASDHRPVLVVLEWTGP